MQFILDHSSPPGFLTSFQSAEFGNRYENGLKGSFLISGQSWHGRLAGIFEGAR
jgi:hypothetical protein